MTPDDRRRAAETILNVPFFNALMDEFEQAAVNACIFAKYDDHEKRQAMAAEARVIKQLRSRLETISKEGQSGNARKAPA